MSATMAACGGTLEPGEEPLGSAGDAIEGSNALNPNALNPNALNPNALDPYDLGLYPLIPGALAPEVMTAIQMPGPDGDRSRALLRYAVSCALSASQSFDFTRTDGSGALRQESYPGLLALAPDWATRALHSSEQEWISACLASRVNWYGTSVLISSRASHNALKKSGTEELITYTREEGAFWGNLFANSPRLFSCHHTLNREYSRSKLRDCAAGHVTNSSTVVPCGMIEIVGDCSTSCEPLHPTGLYRSSCSAPGETQNTQVISVFLD
ncbi:MAG TPA: hypothetical protein VLS89_06170 [Candidatus Nanopelagicales bacterium]|nr:hypothetical protein [Candidatus Nanopelagicales bacterium]